jgi:CxxC-x17-CxxC domain-containing protein
MQDLIIYLAITSKEPIMRSTRGTGRVAVRVHRPVQDLRAGAGIMGYNDGGDRGGRGGRSGGGGGYGGPREFHKTVCSECKKECEVPFKPSGDRPVFCKDCFSKQKSGGR